MEHYVRVKGSVDIGNQQTLEYFTYAIQCYRNETLAGHQNCQTLTQPTLEFMSDFNASCPFSSDICKFTADNLLLDTGYLDSYKDLSMNRGPRFLLRRKVHCAPLVTDGYTKVYTDPQDTSYQYIDYMYGNTSTTSYTYQRHFKPNASGAGRGLDTSADYTVE